MGVSGKVGESKTVSRDKGRLEKEKRETNKSECDVKNVREEDGNTLKK